MSTTPNLKDLALEMAADEVAELQQDNCSLESINQVLQKEIRDLKRQLESVMEDNRSLESINQVLQNDLKRARGEDVPLPCVSKKTKRSLVPVN
jgi:regulator of replication initiation timing